MKILFYDTKKYDKESFDKVLPKYEDIEIEYVDSDISVRNAVYAKGFEAVCGFVSSDFSAKVIDVLADNGVKMSFSSESSGILTGGSGRTCYGSCPCK